MSNLNRRLNELEKTTQPDKPQMVIFTHGGDYWRTTSNDYRQTIGGPGCIPLTPAEVAEFEKTYQVILVEYVDNWKG